MIFALVALVNWWIVAEDGPSAAKVIAAVAASVAAAIQVVIFLRMRNNQGGEDE